MGKREQIKSKAVQRPSSSAFPRLSPFEEMDRFFEGVFPSRWLRPARFEWPAWDESALSLGHAPSVDVIDRDAELVVRAELPGVDKKDVDISVSDNAVTIKASTKQEQKEEKGDYFRSEIRRGSYARTVPLPVMVDADKAKATFNDGMLELSLPKQEGARKRSVKID